MWDEDDSDVYEVPQESGVGPKVQDEFDFGDDVSSDDSSNANPPPKKATTTAKKSPPKPAAQTFDDDSDEVEEWEDDVSDDEQPAKTTPSAAATTTSNNNTNANNNNNNTSAEPATNFDDDSESEEREKGPKARSMKRSKQRKQKIKMLEEKERQAAMAKKNRGKNQRRKKQVVDSSSDSSDSSDDENNAVPTIDDRNTQDNKLLFGSGNGPVAKKRAKKVTKITSIKQLHPISKSIKGRKIQQKELKKLAMEIGDYILDLSMDNIVDQNHKPVLPTLKKYQVKDFACTLIAKLAKSLDIQNLQIIETQVHSEISQVRARINKIAKFKKQGRKIRKGPKRVVYQEEVEETYVDGAYNEGDFDAFL